MRRIAHPEPLEGFGHVRLRLGHRARLDDVVACIEERPWPGVTESAADELALLNCWEASIQPIKSGSLGVILMVLVAIG